MKRFKRFGTLTTGIAIGIVLSVATTAIAAGVIQKAEYNSNKVFFNGQELSLSAPLITVVDEASPGNAVNYMPVRAVLEAMGYEVTWNASSNAIEIDSPIAEIAAQIEEIKDPVSFREMLENLAGEGVEFEIGEVEGGLEAALTKGSLKATVFLPSDNSGASVKCGDKEASFDLIIKDGRSFVNEADATRALKEVGFFK